MCGDVCPRGGVERILATNGERIGDRRRIPHLDIERTSPADDFVVESVVYVILLFAKSLLR